MRGLAPTLLALVHRLTCLSAESAAVSLPLHLDDEYIQKFYQYGYQVEDIYTGKEYTVELLFLSYREYAEVLDFDMLLDI